MNIPQSATGYGVLTNEYDNRKIYSNYLEYGEIPCHSNGIDPSIDEQDGIYLLNGDEGINSYYGSLGNASISTTDSHNRWFMDGYGDHIKYMCADKDDFHDDNDAGKFPDYHSSRYERSFPTERGSSSGVYCDDSFCSVNENPSIVSSPRENDLLAYTTYEDSSSPDNPNLPLLVKPVLYFASTSLVGWNIMNLLLSTSLLALPFAVSRGGFIVLPFILIIALMTNYTSRILVNLMYDKRGCDNSRVRVRIDYADLGREVFNSSKGAVFVQFLLVLDMFAVCILNLCVLGNLGHEIAPSFSIRLCTVIAAIIAFPTFFVRQLIVIGWLQTVGVLSLAIGFILIQVFCLFRYASWSVSSIPRYDIYNLPIAIGIIIYSFGIQGILPGLEERMKTPKKYGLVINVTFTIAVFAQFIFSTTNAMLYGDKTDQLITIDLEDHFALGVTTACFILVSILSHFSLPSMVVMEKMDDALHRLFPCCGSHDFNSLKHRVVRVLLRVIIMGLSLLMAVTVPYFAYLMAFLGSAISVLLSLIVPCLFHLKLRYHVISLLAVFLDIFIILFGITIFFVGFFFSFKAIYSDTKS